MALLQSGTGDGDGPASLLAAWTADGTHWTVSPPLPVHGAQVLSSSAGPGATAAWVLLAGGRAATIAGSGAPGAPGARAPPGGRCPRRRTAPPCWRQGREARSTRWPCPAAARSPSSG